MEILKRYGDRIKALERRDREGVGSGAPGHPRGTGTSNPVWGDVPQHVPQPDARPQDPMAPPYLAVPSFHVPSSAVPMGTGVGPGGHFPSSVMAMGSMRASPPLPEGLQRALFAAVQGQQHEGSRGGGPLGDYGPVSPQQPSQEAAALVRRLYHDDSPVLYGSHGTLSMATQAVGGLGGAAAGVHQQPTSHMAEFFGRTRGVRHAGGSQGYPSYMADVAPHFGPLGAVPLGGIEGTAGTSPRLVSPLGGASRHSGMPAAMVQEAGDRAGSRMSTYLTGLHRALVQGDPVGPAPAAVNDAEQARLASTRPPSRETPHHSPRAGHIQGFGSSPVPAADAGPEDPLVPTSKPPEG